MKIEWNLDKAEIKRFILKEYGLEIKKVKFIPKGEVSYGYLLVSDDGKKFFAKIFPKSRIGQINAKKLDFSLQVSFELFAKCGIKNVVYPILTKDDKLKSKFKGMPFVLFNYIEGKNEEKLDNKEIVKIAKLLGTIHRNSKRVKVKNPRIENFKLDYKQDIMKSLKELKTVKGKDKKKLAEIVLPHYNEIIDYIKNVEGLSKKVKRKDFVICHTDPIGFNLITTENEIFIIDWDAVLIAPKEHDIWFYLRNKSFLKTYEKEFGKFKLNENVVLFYIKDRVLEDFADLLVRILHENCSKQNKIDLFEIKDYCLRDILDKKRDDRYLKIIRDWNKHN